MISKVRNIRNELDNAETVEDKLELIKDLCVGETAYIVTAGPSLGNLDHDLLREKLKDKFVIAIKQAYGVLNDIADIHASNIYNYSHVNYPEKKPIIVYSVPKSYQDNHLKEITKYQIPIDMWFPVVNIPFIRREDSISFSNNFDLFYKLGIDTETQWGPGMTLELGFPLALHTGCKEIVAIGWDIGAGYKNNGTHERFNSGKGDNPVTPQPGELDQARKSTYAMYDWMKEKGIDLKLISDISPADDRFERITLEQIK